MRAVMESAGLANRVRNFAFAMRERLPADGARARRGAPGGAVFEDRDASFFLSAAASLFLSTAASFFLFEPSSSVFYSLFFVASCIVFYS